MLLKQINTNTRFGLAFLGSVLLGIGCLIYIFDPLTILIQRLFVLKPDTLLFKLWLNPAYISLAKIYIFNVTNEEAFLNKKEKLKFNEVGPFTYRFHLSHENPIFNDDGTLTYTNKRNFSFAREFSIGNPNDYNIRVPNLFLVMASLLYHKESMVVNGAIETFCSIFDCKTFENRILQNVLWENKLPFLTWLRAVFPEALIGQDPISMSKINLLDNPHNTLTIVVDTSKYISKSKLLTDDEKNSLYHLVKYNDYSGLKFLGYNESRKSNMKCHSMEGSFDKFFLPPDLNRSRTIRIFETTLCGMVLARPDGLHKTKNGIEGYRYVLDESYLNPPEENPNSDTCCKKEDCQRKGLIPLKSCYFGLPLFLSKPHFYSGDTWLIEQVGGMNPTKEVHDTYVFLHPTLMIPLEARIRFQLNIVFENTENIQSLRAFSNLVYPVAWAEIVIDGLPLTLKILEVTFFHILPMIQSFVTYSFLSLGLILIYLFLVLPLMPKKYYLHRFYAQEYLMIQNISNTTSY